MDITLLAHFVAAAEAPDFARAAQTLGVSRDTLSASVKRVEAELGYALFDRAAESTTLTEIGAAFLDDARLELTEAAARGAQAGGGSGGSRRSGGSGGGGKAKANKGKGRAPAVKGQPKLGKKRQSR
ncbi:MULTISPECIES: LysR family transcriptional regulator [Cryobacterium]|uniref:LysR family transcriptional regulator n=1 Tax=Cryobacterium levicorallinum TaxID=995038 RepID=A0A1I3BGE7_9MICO|nr:MULTISPECIES: LysR family transcriptional regulator [Cryobacterium]TFB82053.1 LysR family transcriptional regulator [Cryobacterium levicorallinum]TFD57020.1 LysR family transcriptional regulator [Cryobacterium sp. Hh38]SFH61342.1 regulatory helix-turn-helix protein, lysR family [Cryobacterium levicorallinum]